MGEQRLFQEVAADARAAALVADLEAPAADGARPAVLARHIGGAGTEDGHAAVAGADGAFQRDLGVGLDAAPAERQYGFELLPIGADIGAGEAQNRRRFGDQRWVLPGVAEGQPCGVHDMGAGAGEVGADVGGAAPAAADDGAVRHGQRGSATGSTAVDAEHETHNRGSPRA